MSGVSGETIRPSIQTCPYGTAWTLTEPSPCGSGSGSGAGRVTDGRSRVGGAERLERLLGRSLELSERELLELRALSVLRELRELSRDESDERELRAATGSGSGSGSGSASTSASACAAAARTVSG
jgi:hypothetical protein